MLSELPCKAWLDGLAEERLETKRKLFKFNNSFPEGGREQAEQLRAILGKAGKNIHIEPPFRCDYGTNIEVGDNFYANFNCVILDVGRVIIGNNVKFGPNVSLYTAGHPVHPESRRSGYEYGIGISIGNDVWLGGNVVVNQGVNIGENAVVGSGSVVTKDIPANVIAAGNPCRVIREITDEDRRCYYRNRLFDVDDY